MHYWKAFEVEYDALEGVFNVHIRCATSSVKDVNEVINALVEAKNHAKISKDYQSG